MDKGKEVVRVSLGDSSEPNVKYLPIATDHSGMVKYSSNNDDKYDYVKNNIETMVQEAVTARDRRLEAERAKAEEDEIRVLKLKRAKPLRDKDLQGKGKGKEKGNVLKRRN